MKKSDLREALSFRRVELELANPLCSAVALNRLLATEFNIKEHAVRYYLRTQAATDGRICYTEGERRRLSAMNRRELEVYACQNGKNFKSLYAMVWRYKNRDEERDQKQSDRINHCTSRGYMDFGRLADLKAFSLPGDAYKEARKAIQAVQKLDLLPPNYIIHRPSHKFYALSIPEQVFLLKNPRRFLKETAGKITANWRSCDPASHYFILLDSRFESPQCEGVALSAHETLDLAVQAQQRVAGSPQAVPTRIIRRFGSSKVAFNRYTDGERVPKFAPDTMPEAIHDPIIEAMNAANALHARNAPKPPCVVDPQDDKDEGDCGVADDEDEGDCGVEDDEETIL